MARILLASLFSFSVLLLCAGCSKAGTDSIPIGEQELPDMVLHDATYTLGQPSEKPMVMKAATIEIYSSSRGTMLADVSFTREGELSGSCSTAAVSQDNDHAVLSGNVVMTVTAGTSDPVTIEAENLVWDDSTSSVWTTDEVSLTYADGTSIKAIGFSAVFTENLYEFSQILEGRITE